MSDPSRKVNNPLLSAAGQGFPFEGYSSNPLLVPVTPATPAILQDAGPEDFLVQNRAAGGEIQPQATAEIDLSSVHNLGTNPQNSPTHEREIPEQPVKQGYFTSILSSLPNLSLSSITGDSSASAQQQPPPKPVDSSSYGFSQNPYGPPVTSGTVTSPSQSHAPPSQYSQGFSEIGLSPLQPEPNPPRPPPTVTALPPSGGPGSYRLGNQRRLKYAPPPDLTSTNPKPNSAPPPPNFFAPQPPSGPGFDFRTSGAINQPIPSGPFFPASLPSFGPQSGNTSQDPSTIPSAPAQSFPNQLPSFTPPANPPSNPPPSQPTPVTSGFPGNEHLSSLPRQIAPRVPEPATPQNTPANATFAGFHPSFDTSSRIPTSVVPAQISENFSSNPTSSNFLSSFDNPLKFSTSGLTPVSESLTFEPKNFPYDRNNPVPTSNLVSQPDGSSFSQETALKSAEEKSFTPISAAKVTAKLENLLAERQEESPSIFTPKVESPTTSSEILESAGDKSISGQDKTEDLAEVDLTSKPRLIDFSRAVSKRSGELDLTPALVSFPQTGSLSTAPVKPDVPPQYSAGGPQQTTQIDPSTYFKVEGDTRQSDTTFYSAPSANPPEAASSFFYRTADQPGQQHEHLPALTVPADSQKSVPTFYNPANLATAATLIFSSTISNSGNWNTNTFTGAQHFSSPIFPASGSFAMPEPTTSASLDPIQMSVSPGQVRSPTEMVPPSLQNLATATGDRKMPYRPVYHHWFYQKNIESKVLWLPFSMQDSLSLEDIHNSPEITPETTVATDGGRYDVDILHRRRKSVYWPGSPMEVRRSSWFHKGTSESRYVPYEESTATRLEQEYKDACLTDNWNRRVELSNGEYIIFHSSTVQVHHVPVSSPELAASWGNSTGSENGAYLQGAASRPKVVKRGVDEFNIDEGEPEKVDHLLFLVHGIGSVCDLKFRTVEEVVDEFRSISLQLVQSHYRTASTHGIVNRIEVLPISWHTTLHSEATGIDKKLEAITLESIPKLRHFTNDTLLDILFYTSPIYCQTIMQTVGNEMNRLYSMFKDRNSNFEGSVYLGGHSLGSLILFDLLCHQKPAAEEPKAEEDPANLDNKSDDDTVGIVKAIPAPVMKRRLSKKVSYVMGAAGTGQPYINYPQLNFFPRAFFALGSPIGMFVTVRGIDTLGEDFVLPTCPAFFNVFHPFDPVAYRVESLIKPDAHKFRPMLIPHHKGRKRMHLELKETMARVGADLKQKLLDSMRSTWNSVYQLAMFHRTDNRSFEQEIEKVVEEQLHNSPPSVHEHLNEDDGGADFQVGKLNGGRRIDYVLQEAPFEYINEYLFALTSHVCYWESEDTMLMILKEIYGTNGIQADAQLPPQTMTIERSSPAPFISGASTSGPSPPATSPIGIDPTIPISGKSLGPPPTSGFVRGS